MKRCSSLALTASIVAGYATLAVMLGPSAAAVTSASVAASTSAASTSTLSGGQTLSAGQSIWSPNGKYQLVMQTNGNLVEYGPSGAVWATGTPSSGNHVTMQTDGNLVVYTSGGQALWQSGTGGNSGTFTLNLGNDGNIVINDGQGPLWSSTSSMDAGAPNQTLSAGQSIWSPNGKYQLVMQTNGNLVEYGPSGAVWATGTPSSGNHVTMQTDGNLVVYTSGGQALWQSGTGGNSGGFVLDLENNGNLAMYGVNGLGEFWSRESSLSAGSPDQTLSAGQSIWSPNGKYQLVMQTNGNLVEYGPSGAVWATGTPSSGNHVTMQTDGNLVVYTSGGQALWQSGTGGNSGGFVLDLENNGGLQIFGVGGRGLMWTAGSNTGGGYPYASAVCYYGSRGGPHCINPSDPGDENDWYDWGYWKGSKFDFYDQWGYEYRNCTSYVAWKLSEAGVSAALFSDLGNADQWIGHVSGKRGVVVNGTPSPGAVAVWDSPGVGHVAWVDSVSGGTVTVSDYNLAATGVYAEHPISSKPSAYIHFP